MILWNLQLRPMHQVCRNKLLCLFVLCLTLSGCSAKHTEIITVGEWIKEMVEQAEIPPSYDSISYFMNVDKTSLYYDAIQSATKYGILSNEYALDTDQVLNREWCAYTLINLSMRKLTSVSNVKDIQRSMFPQHVETAVSSGLMDTDKHGRFKPKEIVDKQEALILLQKVLSYIDHPEFENTFSYEVNKDITTTPLQDAVVDPVTLQASTLSDVEKGQYVSIRDTDGSEKIYTVESVTSVEGGNQVQLQVADPLEYLESMNIQGEEELDFEKAVLIDGDTEAAKNMSMTSRSKTIQGYTFAYTVSRNGVRVTISKPMEHGDTLYGELKLNGIHVKYKWLTEKKDIKNAYFSLQAHSQESLGIKAGKYASMYGDFSSLSAEDFIGSLSSFLKPKSEIEAVDIPICTLRVPLETAQMLTVKIRISVKIYASGKAELVLSQDHVLGCDIRNGVPRMIHDTKHSQSANLRADTSLCTNLTCTLDFIQASLMDIYLEAGAKASIASVAHLYDDTNHHKVQTVDYPLDIVDELSQHNGNVLCCGDMKAYWILNLGLNSSSTITGKLGLGKKYTLMNENNAPLFKGLNQHIENFKVVDKCTRTDRKKSELKDTIKVDKQITLSSYNLVVHIGESKSFKITGLPAGYTEKDLVFTSKDNAIAQVSASGVISGYTVGSTSVDISTSDGKYSLQGNVLVTKG